MGCWRSNSGHSCTSTHPHCIITVDLYFKKLKALNSTGFLTLAFPNSEGIRISRLVSFKDVPPNCFTGEGLPRSAQEARGTASNSQPIGPMVECKGPRMWCCLVPAVPGIFSGNAGTSKGCTSDARGGGNHMVPEIKLSCVDARYPIAVLNLDPEC